MRAIIISGGKGERLRPITYEIPKGLLPIKGRKLLDFALDLFYKFNIYEIWLSVGYKGNEIIDKYPFPHFFDRTPIGTGGWMYYATCGDYWKNEDFFVCNGDNLFDLNLDEMKELHKKTNAVVTIACSHVKDVTQYGSVHIEGDLIKSFEEKKKSRIRKGGWISGGYYLFSPKIFEYLDKCGKKFPEPISLERDIFPLVAKEGRMSAYKTDVQWFDTGDFDRYEQIEKEWKGITPHE